MSGMYPNEQILEVFGEQVKWPGLGPDGKFTNGSFSDPQIKPSFIPAETLNLLLDNMQQTIEGAGLEPNNFEQDQLSRALQALGIGRHAATSVIGSSVAGHTLADCDYLCDGVDDQIEINAAIQALRPCGGGKIAIREGAYSITASITVDVDNITIEGMGASTALKGSARGAYEQQALILCTARYIKIGSLHINVGRTDTDGINLLGNNCFTDTCICKDGRNGIYLSSSGCKAIGCECYGNVTGINIVGCGCEAVDCECHNNSSSGIRITGKGCKIIGCYLYGNDGTYGAILIYGASMCTIFGNVSIDNRIALYHSAGSLNTIAGNALLRDTGQPSDYDANQYTLRLGQVSKDNLFIGNHIMGKNYTDGSGNATNTFINNKYN